MSKVDLGIAEATCFSSNVRTQLYALGYGEDIAHSVVVDALPDIAKRIGCNVSDIRLIVSDKGDDPIVYSLNVTLPKIAKD